jgi:hypothetical protein
MHIIATFAFLYVSTLFWGDVFPDIIHIKNADDIKSLLPSLCYALTLIGLAGCCLALTPYKNMAKTLISIGTVGICAGLTHSFASIIPLTNGWELHAYKASLHIGMLMLFCVMGTGRRFA